MEAGRGEDDCHGAALDIGGPEIDASVRQRGKHGAAQAVAGYGNGLVAPDLVRSHAKLRAGNEQERGKRVSFANDGVLACVGERPLCCGASARPRLIQSEPAAFCIRQAASSDWSEVVATNRGSVPTREMKSTVVLESPLQFRRDRANQDVLKITLEKSGSGASLTVAWGTYRIAGSLKAAS